MIRINLLPVGLRKRQRVGGGGGGITLDIPIALVGAVIVLLAAGFWAWVKWDRIPRAQKELARVTALCDAAEAQAKKVDQVKEQIAKFEEKVNFLASLIGRRVKWAHTLDDFCTLLGTDGWPAISAPTVAAGPEGAVAITEASDADTHALRVSCRKLSLKEEGDSGGRTRGGGSTAAAKASVLWSIDLNFQLVGQDSARRGEYIKIFYDGLRRSSFWQNHNLINDPEEFYNGDKWDEIKGMGLTQCEQDMKPLRQHLIQSAGELTKSKQGSTGERGGSTGPRTAPQAVPPKVGT